MTTMTSAPTLTEVYDVLEEMSRAEVTNRAAMIGLFGALIGLAPVAVVFGLIGMLEADRRPHETGSWIGFAALIVGLLEFLAFIIIGITMAR